MGYLDSTGLSQGALRLSNEIRNELKDAEKHNRIVNNPNNIHSYPAKMVKSIPEVIIPKFSKPGDLILDPFCGSGTVLLGSKVHKRNAIGFDINPLAVLISNVKVKDIDKKSILRIKTEILENAKLKKTKYDLGLTNKDYWFTKSAQRQLGALFIEIKKIANPTYRRFFLLCLSSCVRYASKADPEIVPPVISKRMRSIIKHRKVNVIGKFSKIVDKNTDALLTIPQNIENLEIDARLGDARALPIENDSVDLVLTSPPYISAQKYPRSLKLELFWTGLTNQKKFSKVDSETIGTEKVSLNKDFSDIKIKDKNLYNILKRIKSVSKERYVITVKYFIDMEKSIKEIYRVVKPGSYFVLLIGENTVCGNNVPNGKILAKYATLNGFRIITAVKDKIKAYGFMTRRNKTAGIIDREEIIIFQKPN